MTYDEICQRMPDEYEAGTVDKFRYRYPRGESYQDVIQRLEPVIFELERERAPVLVIGHQAVLRALYAYMMDSPPHECPFVSIPLHTVLELEPTAYGCDERRIRATSGAGESGRDPRHDGLIGSGPAGRLGRSAASKHGAATMRA